MGQVLERLALLFEAINDNLPVLLATARTISFLLDVGIANLRLA